MNTVLETIPEIDYPDGDGQPMAETGFHVLAMILLRQALQEFFKDRPDVFIATDMFWYFEEGVKTSCLAPDCMVVPGVGNHERRSFFSWRDRGTPSVVFEMASEGTWKKDLKDKYAAYEKQGVREYFIFDPLGEFLIPSLQGFRLEGGFYRRIFEDENDWFSSEMEFDLKEENGMIRLRDRRTGRLILTQAEMVEAAEREVESARDSLKDAEERVEAAEEKKRRTETELAAEKARADALAAELAALKAQLKSQP